MNTIKKYIKIALLAIPVMGMSGSLASCGDMLDTDSELYAFVDDHKLNTAQDTLSSVMGVISKMQIVADRNVLISELRSDQLAVNDRATTAVKKLANFDFSGESPYCNISDYYAIVNNCNYFIENADTALSRLGKKIFEKDFAAIKTYRAWTYLQLAKTYGKVPLVLKPLLTEKEAQEAVNMNYSDINEICDFFIKDLQDCIDKDLPQYRDINGVSSKYFYIPTRVLLGEMCLWTGRYNEAAKYFYDFLTNTNQPRYTGKYRASWVATDNDFTNKLPGTSSYLYSCTDWDYNDILTFIPMESTELEGTKSYLEDVYASTINNNYYAQVVPSNALFAFSKSQNYVYLLESAGGKKDTIYVPKTGLYDVTYAGDLRLAGSYDKGWANVSANSPYSKERTYIYKTLPVIYRLQYVYLMFAEALCRAGYPETAFCILKYGLTEQNIERYISEAERTSAAAFHTWNNLYFDETTTMSIRKRGCGDVDCDTLYVLPQPETELASYADTVKYQIPLLEDMIINEMALETMFEGKRYYDLMRVAMRRNDPSYLATPIAKRNCDDKNTVMDKRIYNLLMDQKNWYLPIK